MEDSSNGAPGPAVQPTPPAAPDPDSDAEKRLLEAPDTLGARLKYPIQAQPPEALTGLRLGKPATVAAGITAVFKSGAFAFAEDGPVRGTRALLRLNQKNGFDCSSCAWPDPDEHRSVAEFCENGAMATASDAQPDPLDPEYFAQYSLAEFSDMTDRDLNNAGRLTHPLVLWPDATHYTPISWPEAFQIIADKLNDLDSPNEAVFYTCGKVPNEPAFLYQLLARQFGTNNLPDSSNMCHESSAVALTGTIGTATGTVTLNDLHEAEVILVIGQNPGTNHPRMLSALQKAKRNGAKIISLNPLLEAGLLSFRNPQDFMDHHKILGALLGQGTFITDHYLQLRLNSDQLVLRGLMKGLLEAEALNPGLVLDHDFIAGYTTGYAELLDALNQTSWAAIEEASGIGRAQLQEVAGLLARHQKIVTCWSMGLAQQKSGASAVREIVNLHLLKGAIGRPGAGLCAVRGHSNVQGDRTMGIGARPAAPLLDALAREFRFEPPRAPGYGTVDAVRAMHAGRVKVFVALGGNLLSACADTEFVAAAMRKLHLSVHIAPKLNRSHLVNGDMALLLPCYTRVDIDRQEAGEQFVSCENAMGIVSRSQGVLEPLSEHMRSEVAIVCGIAQATLGARSQVDWAGCTENYDHIRDYVARTIPGFEAYNAQVRDPAGFYLPNGPRERRFATPDGKAHFSRTPLETSALAPGQLVLMTIRAHAQFNTTIYDYNDRYRGVYHERRVIFLNRADMAARGIREKQLVDITSHFEGQQRHAQKFIAVPYDIPRGNCAVYFPEGNVLVPIGSVDRESSTPTSKYVVVTVVPADPRPDGAPPAPPRAARLA